MMPGGDDRLAASTLMGGALVATFFAFLLTVSNSLALGLMLGANDSEEPISIEADEGIEWQQANQLYVARGDARATKGEVTLSGDELTAHYRPDDAGGTEIWRIEARGNVRISSPTEFATGDLGIYDVDSAILVLTGQNLVFQTPTERITARESLEYWEEKNMAVARGQALAVQGDKELRADILSAQLREGDEGSLEIYRLEAFGNVEVITGSEVARAEYGDYDVESGVATLRGSVKITKGQNQLNGEYAEVDLNSGISRMLAGPGTPGGKQRVHGLLTPQAERKNEAVTTTNPSE